METQQKVRGQRKTMLPFVISTVVTFTIFLFIFWTASKEIEFQVEQGKAGIEAPQRNTSFGLKFFDANGEIVR